MPIQKRKHTLKLSVICASWSLVIIFLYAFHIWVLRKTDYKFKDVISSLLHVREDGRIALLAIDAESLSLTDVYDEELKESRALQLMKQGFPWSREVYGLVAAKLLDAGARCVVFDLMFPSAGKGDDEFRQVLERYRNRVVVGFLFPSVTSSGGNESLVQLPSPTLLPAVTSDPRLGFVNVWEDPDEVVRHLWYRRTFFEVMNEPPSAGQEVFESLAAKGLRQGGFGQLIPNDTQPRIIPYAYAGFRGERSSLEPHSLWKIFTGLWQQNYAGGAFFKDKIVIVGPLGEWSKDFVPTPLGRIPGMLVHANAMNALLTGQFLHETPLWADLLLIASGGAISWLFGFFVRRPGIRAVCLIGALLGWLGIAFLLFRAGWVILVFSPMLAIGSSAASYFTAELFSERKEHLRIRRTLERYVSKDVVQEVLDNPESYLNTVGGARRRISILFSDVRGFTMLTEEADASKLVLQLNEYFTEMVKIVFAHDGTLDKFIGDAVMAHWGGIISHGDSRDACHAVSTALEMLRSLDRLNSAWKQQGMPELRIGVGINHGEAIVGNLGSQDKTEFSAIGDPVNTASRLEGATKELRLDLLLGGSVAPLVEHRFRLRTVDLLLLKGKSEPVEVFTTLGEKGTSECPEWLTAHEEGVQLYRKREFDEAIRRFETAAELHPGDGLITEYLRRCRACLEKSPAANWNGVFVMTEK